jgi:hypothetical protein
MRKRGKPNWIILTIVFVVIAFVSMVVSLRYRDATFGVKVSSASGFSDLHARTVFGFFNLSNSLPISKDEVSEYILGDNLTNGWYYKTVNASTKQFLLGQAIDSRHVFEATYQIFATGLVRQSSQVIKMSTRDQLPNP